MATPDHEDTEARLARIRSLLHRLARVRNSALEAELIAELTLETEAVDRARRRAGSGGTAGTRSRPGGR